eukprot:848003-Pelagomonas_calceolata.AAC.6
MPGQKQGQAKKAASVHELFTCSHWQQAFDYLRIGLYRHTTVTCAHQVVQGKVYSEAAGGGSAHFRLLIFSEWCMVQRAWSPTSNACWQSQQSCPTQLHPPGNPDIVSVDARVKKYVSSCI